MKIIKFFIISIFAFDPLCGVAHSADASNIGACKDVNSMLSLFPAEKYTGPIELNIDFSQHPKLEPVYRSVLSECLNAIYEDGTQNGARPGFASHYEICGCGHDCDGFFIINMINGNVAHYTLEQNPSADNPSDDLPPVSSNLFYRSESRVLAVNPNCDSATTLQQGCNPTNNKSRCPLYYLWTGNRFKKIPFNARIPGAN